MDYRIRLKKLEEDVLTPLQKMRAWANGDRKENVKACSDGKLKVYYDICVQNGYTQEANVLKDEAKNRGLIWAWTNTNRISVSDLDLDLFKYVRDHSAQDIYKNYHNSGMRVTDWLTFLLYAIALKQYDTIDFLKKEISKSFNISEADIKSIMQEAAKDSELMKKLTEFIFAGESSTLTEEKLYEAPEKHDTLNPKLWDIESNTLRPEVKEKIIQIVDDFCEDLKNDDIKFNLKDVKLVGSNCSYNYNDKSDLDIHLVMETNSLHCPDNLYPLLYSAYRSIWNKNHEIDFYGIPVEIFVETDDTEQLDEARQQTALKSNGIYSVLNDSWIKEPVAESIPNIDQAAFEELLNEWENKYFEIKENPSKDAIEKFIEDIYELRKTSIADDGEYGLGNLVFKECRNLGYLDNLKDLKRDIVNKELSLS